MNRRRFVFLLSFAFGSTFALPAVADTWPDKPIKFLVSAPAGSSLDVVARLISDKLKDRLGVPVVVENKAGASGTIAVTETARAAADGNTMVLSYNGPLAYGPLLQKLPYDVQKDLVPVMITTSQPNVLAVNAQLPAKTVQELVAWVKANPGKFNYASVGNGSSSQLAMEYFKSIAGIEGTHVPFNGSPPAVISTVQGDTQAIFAVMSPLQPQIKAGKLRAIAVTTGNRRVRLPRVRCSRVERNPDACGDTEADHRAAEHGNERDHQVARCREEVARRGLRSDRRCARGSGSADRR